MVSVEVQNKNYTENLVNIELYTCMVSQWLRTGFLSLICVLN